MTEALSALVLALTYILLFAFRSADDNALTSWAWVFSHPADTWRFLPVLAALPLAALLARARAPTLPPAAALFAAAFAAGALFWGEPEVIVDAARHFTQAKHLELYGWGFFLAEWGRGIPAWTDLPLVPFLYGSVFRLFGEHRLGVQVLTTALFAGTCLLIARLGERLWDERTGWLAGWLLLAIPYLLVQVPLLMSDVPTMFFFTLAVALFVEALQRGGAWTLLAALALLLALLAKYSTWPLATTLPVAALVWAVTRGARPHARRAAAVFLIAAFPAAALTLWKLDLLRDQLELLSSYQWTGLRRWGESWGSSLLFQTSPLVTAAAVWSTALCLAKRDWRVAIAGWPLLVLLLLGVERSRYLLPALPFLALLAARGLAQLDDGRLRRFLALAALLPSLALAVGAYLPFLRHTSAANLQRAGAFLDTLPVTRVEVVTPEARVGPVNPAVAVPLLDLFTSRTIGYRGSTARPPDDAVTRSPLRFTWELPTPGYYQSEPFGPAAVVVISTTPYREQVSPELAGRLERLPVCRSFSAADDPFVYKTFVTVHYSCN